MTSYRTTAFISALFVCAVPLLAQVGPAPQKISKGAYRIGKDEVAIDDLIATHTADFYDLEKKRYELVEKLAKEGFLEQFWAKLAERDHISVAEAREKYLKAHVHVSDAEIQETLERFKGHPRMHELKEVDRRVQATEYLKATKSRETIEQIIASGLRTKELVVLYPRPAEPLFDVVVRDAEPLRFGPQPDDATPVTCKAADCVTIVEYAEYQCPISKREQAVLAQVLTEYRGRVRLVTRDFPLGVHGRSRPAALAAKCAGEQGKFWHMHDILFENQRMLSDDNISAHAKAIGLDVPRFQLCFANPVKHNEAIDQNYQSGEALGVSATPTYFIGGSRLLVPPSLDELRKFIDEDLARIRRLSIR